MHISGRLNTAHPTGIVTRVTTVILSPDGIVKSQHTIEKTTSFPVPTNFSSPKLNISSPKPVHRPTQSMNLSKPLKKSLKLDFRSQIPSDKKRVWRKLLERCDNLGKEVTGQWHEASKSGSTRREEWAKAKEYVEEASHKSAWRHSYRYKRKRAEIEIQTRTWDSLSKAKDREIILNITSPEVSPHSKKKAFVKIEDLTPSRMRSLGLVSKRSFGGTPLSRVEVIRNIEKLSGITHRETGPQTDFVLRQGKRLADTPLNQGNIEKIQGLSEVRLSAVVAGKAEDSIKRHFLHSVAEKNRNSIRKSLTETFISAGSLIL